MVDLSEMLVAQTASTTHGKARDPFINCENLFLTGQCVFLFACQYGERMAQG
jgi:hypothetical protein